MRAAPIASIGHAFQEFDPLVAALAQLVRDRYAAEQALPDNVVALRRDQSKRPSVQLRALTVRGAAQ